MSLDYPEYEELRKKSKFLGLLWRIGDVGYYIGLTSAIVSPLAIVFIQLTNRKSPSLSWNTAILIAIQTTVFWSAVFWSCAKLKNCALRKGRNLKNKL